MFQDKYWYLLVLLTMFGIVILHEFGHALACRSVGGKANTIVLWPLGGIAIVQPPPRPGAMLWSIAAGPLVNVVLLPILWIIYFTAAPDHTTMELRGQADWQQYLLVVAVVNTGLLVFNMLPLYPLDGGQMVQSILWFFVGRVKSLKIAAVLGLVGAIVLGILMLRFADIYMAIMALFIGMEAWNGLRIAKYLEHMESSGYATGTAEVPFGQR